MITYIYISCNNCINYARCKQIEDKFRNELIMNGGNWRAVFNDGKHVGTPIRRCSLAIVTKYIEDFKNKRVLEIGCGPLSEINYQFCRENGVKYTGIKPKRIPRHFYLKNKYLRKGLDLLYKFLKLKRWAAWNKYQNYIIDYFPSKKLKLNTYDIIYSNSTIEHWHEDEKDYEKSVVLYNNNINICYNLLRKGGKLKINCLIFVHGNFIFMHGRVDLIEKFFENQWESIIFEKWRFDYSGLMPYCPDARKNYFKSEFNIDLKNIWILNIIA